MCFDGVSLQFLLPLIIEKLDSDVQSAKLDSLQTLVKTSHFICFFIYIYIWAMCCRRSINKSSNSEQRPAERLMMLDGCLSASLGIFHRLLTCHHTFIFPPKTACVSQYEHKDLADFLEGLWASLRREVSLTKRLSPVSSSTLRQ